MRNCPFSRAKAEDFDLEITQVMISATFGCIDKFLFMFQKNGGHRIIKGVIIVHIMIKQDLLSIGITTVKRTVDPTVERDDQVFIHRITNIFFLAGLTFPYLPHRRGRFSHVPRGAVFGHASPMLQLPLKIHWSTCALLNSDVFLKLIQLLIARGTQGGQTLKYEVGYVRAVPIPTGDARGGDVLECRAVASYTLARKLSTSTGCFSRRRRTTPSGSTTTGSTRTSSSRPCSTTSNPRSAARRAGAGAAGSENRLGHRRQGGQESRQGH